MNKSFKLGIFLLATSLLFSIRPLQAAYDDYTAYPPFLSSAVPPNILLVLDRSGSMGWNAYAGTFSNTTTYEGYFTPTSVYEYNATGYWEESTVTTTSTCGTPSTANRYTGSCLNFQYMDRVDLLRWSLTGGKPAGCSGNDSQTCDPDLTTAATCSGTTCQLVTNGSVQVEVPKTRISGILQEFETKSHRPRFGVIFYESGVHSDSVYIGDYYNANPADPNNPYTYTKRFINAMPVGGMTASGPSLEEAYDYFKQDNDHTSNTSPFIFASDHKDPINICEADCSNCASAPCMKNFVIFVSDGNWNTGADPVRPAYEMHTEVLRTLDSIDIKVESVFTLGLFLGGSGELALKHTAMFGSFDTTGRTWPGGTTGYPNTSLTTAIPNPSFPDWDADLSTDPGYLDPDTFFSAQDAGQIKDGLMEYIYDILKKSAAGSAVSILAERRVSGLAVHQALFFPSKYYNTDYKVDWSGVLNAYWFYNTLGVSNIREDNTNSFFLDKLADHPLDFRIDNTGSLSIDYYQTESNGGTDFATGALGSYNSVEEVHKIWEGGEKLRQRNGSDRLIFGVNEQNQMTDFSTADTIVGTVTTVSGTTKIGLFDDLLGDDGSMDPCLGDTDTDRPTNLIKYIRGESDDFSATVGGCRTRIVNNAGDSTAIWKLGDTINSTPWVVNYDSTTANKEHGVLYMGSNDGMLHAFHVGKLRTDSLGTDQVVKLCDQKTGTCTQNVIGDELWSFIPKNVMPYLRYLADPNYQHMYTVDLAPYVVEDNGKKILIGGMRFGGATGCVAGNSPKTDWCGGTAADGKIELDSDGEARKQIIPPGDVNVGFEPDGTTLGVCSKDSPENCGGLSSYFAIDITDAYDPKFLWEFTHKDLGFAYSGPAFIKRVNPTDGSVNRYLMFLSGPTNYKGFAIGQSAQAFILKVDGDFKTIQPDGLGGVKAADWTNNPYILPLLTTKDSYGGRLFTNGIDANLDGNTDLVAFGVNWWAGSNWQGNVYGIGPTDEDPCTDLTCSKLNWEVAPNALNLALAPVTGKVVYNQCFGEPFIYISTGRWLYKNDSPGSGSNPNALYGVKLGGCLENLMDNDSPKITTCADAFKLNSIHSSSDMCDHLTDPSASWKIDNLKVIDGEFLEERSMSDPTGSSFNAVFFTTTRPSSNICAFGGVTRLWGVNCMNGDAMTKGCPNYIGNPPDTSVLLQLSGGNIEDESLAEAFTEEGGRATEESPGIPPESGATVIPPTGAIGEIILWIEQ